VVDLLGRRWVERRRSSLLYEGESDPIEAKGEAGTEVNVDFSFHRRMLCPQPVYSTRVLFPPMSRITGSTPLQRQLAPLL